MRLQFCNSALTVAVLGGVLLILLLLVAKPCPASPTTITANCLVQHDVAIASLSRTTDSWSSALVASGASRRLWLVIPPNVSMYQVSVPNWKQVKPHSCEATPTDVRAISLTGASCNSSAVVVDSGPFAFPLFVDTVGSKTLVRVAIVMNKLDAKGVLDLSGLRLVADLNDRTVTRSLHGLEPSYEDVIFNRRDSAPQRVRLSLVDGPAVSETSQVCL